MKSTEPTLYLYSRVSTEKQTRKGKKGLDRQQVSKDVLKTIEIFPDFPIVRMSDEGMSAHHGVNIDKGELGKFIELCRIGEIAPGSVIAMEALDRFTRLSLSRANSLTLTVLEAEVKIYTWSTKQTFNRDNFTDALNMLVLLEGANQYSKALSHKIVGSAMDRIKDAYDISKRSKDGYCSSVGGYGTSIWWADIDNGFVIPHPYYFKIAREIADLILTQKLSAQKIREHLTAKGYKPPVSGKPWGYNMISKFHLNGHIIGEVTFNNKKDKTTHFIPNYYPPVVTDSEYRKILEIKKLKRAKRDGVKAYSGLFSGGSIFRCGFCGKGISVFNGRSKAHKYKCNGMYNPAVKCEGTTADARYVDVALIKLIGTIITQKPLKDNSLELSKLERELSKQRRLLQSLTEDLKSTSSNVARKAIINELNDTGYYIEKLDSQLDELKSIPVADSLSIFSIPPKIINYENVELRDEFTVRAFTHVKKITMKISPNFQDIRVELFSGLEINASLIGRKILYFKDETLFDAYHRSDDIGGVGAMDASERWYGVDRDGKEIKLLSNLTGIDHEKWRNHKKALNSYHDFIKTNKNALIDPQNGFYEATDTIK